MEVRKRPVGISILSVLHIMGGIGAGAFLVEAIARLATRPFVWRTQFAAFAALSLLLLVSMAVLAVASGIGMWRGKKWAWYIGSFWYIYEVVRNLVGIAVILGLLNVLQPGKPAPVRHGPAFYCAILGARALVGLLLYLYFFRRNVAEFFSLSDEKHWKTVLAQGIVCVGIVAFFAFVARFAAAR